MRNRRSVAQSIVIGSSQLITTLSALAYLRWRGIRDAHLQIVSLQRDDLVHSASGFVSLQVALAQQDGHQCVFVSRGAPPTQAESLSCDLLLLPRLDDREGQLLLHCCQTREVVELGESIGVETRLYSLSACRTRQRMLLRLQRSMAEVVIRRDPLVPLHRSIDLPRLRCLLEVCGACRKALASASSAAATSTLDGVMLCLPYLKIKVWRVRLRMMGRSFGLRQSPVIRNGNYLRAAIRLLVRQQPSDVPLLLQAHPRNVSDHSLIRTLFSHLKSCGPFELLPADAPLEARLSSRPFTQDSRSVQVAGFGTNLLAAAVFLHPCSDCVHLCQTAGCRWWVDAVLNRREWLRQRQVKAALTNLQSALRQLPASQ